MLTIILKILFNAVVWIITLISFKIIDWITNALVKKTYKIKNGLKPNHRSRPLPLLFFGVKEQNITPDIFDSICIQWGISKDFYDFKKSINFLSKKEENYLNKWENIWKGKGCKPEDDINDKNSSEVIM